MNRAFARINGRTESHFALAPARRRTSTTEHARIHAPAHPLSRPKRSTARPNARSPRLPSRPTRVRFRRAKTRTMAASLSGVARLPTAVASVGNARWRGRERVVRVAARAPGGPTPSAAPSPGARARPSSRPPRVRAPDRRPRGFPNQTLIPPNARGILFPRERARAPPRPNPRPTRRDAEPARLRANARDGIATRPALSPLTVDAPPSPRRPSSGSRGRASGANTSSSFPLLPPRAPPRAATTTPRASRTTWPPRGPPRPRPWATRSTTTWTR